MFQIVQSPAEILRTPTQPVNFSGAKLQKIIDEMIKTMVAQKDPEGVGLAANQVNLPYSIFIARFSTKKNEPIRIFINPEILAHSDRLQLQNEDKKSAPLEGCLSKPQYYGSVKRWKWVKVRYQTLPDPSGKTDKSKTSDNVWQNLTTSEKVFSDFASTVIQHEMDHLQGKLFIERILEQKGKLYQITGKDKKGKDVWEEVEL